MLRTKDGLQYLYYMYICNSDQYIKSNVMTALRLNYKRWRLQFRIYHDMVYRLSAEFTDGVFILLHIFFVRKGISWQK